MEKEFVPYGLALRMKVIGFNEPCLAIYDNITDENDKDDSDRFFYIRTEGWPKELFDKVTPVPLFSQAFRWFDYSTEWGGFIVPSREEGCFDWWIQNYTDPQLSIESDEWYRGREEAELACLEKLIKIVESKTEK